MTEEQAEKWSRVVAAVTLLPPRGVRGADVRRVDGFTYWSIEVEGGLSLTFTNRAGVRMGILVSMPELGADVSLDELADAILTASRLGAPAGGAP
jgi:hypothetical protein